MIFLQFFETFFRKKRISSRNSIIKILMYGYMKRTYLIVFAIFAALTLNAQEDGEKLSLTVDLASDFVWRGLQINSTPVIQPSVTFSQGIFSIGAWASTPFTRIFNEHKEFDIFAELQLSSSLSLGLISYYDYSAPYFKLKKEETAHDLDLYLTYDGSGGFPIRVLASTIIGGGADLKWKDGKNKRAFSTYLELGYGRTTNGGIEWNAFLGFVPMESNFYEIDGAAIINLGFGVTKSFEITPTYSLPLSLKLTVNPAYEAVYLTAAVKLF